MRKPEDMKLHDILVITRGFSTHAKTSFKAGAHCVVTEINSAHFHVCTLTKEHARVKYDSFTKYFKFKDEVEDPELTPVELGKYTIAADDALKGVEITVTHKGKSYTYNLEIPDES